MDIKNKITISIHIAFSKNFNYRKTLEIYLILNLVKILLNQKRLELALCVFSFVMPDVSFFYANIEEIKYCVLFIIFLEH